MSNMENWVSPQSKRKDFNNPYTLADKLRIFEERVDGWQIRIAEIILKQIKAQEPEGMQHAAYALISIIFSYFEMIGDCIPRKSTDDEPSGICASIQRFLLRIAFWLGEGQAESSAAACFKRGFAAVFPKFSGKQIQKVYAKVRCGMYHIAYTKKGVVIDGEFETPFKVMGQQIEMNPHLLVPAIRNHFTQFMNTLKMKNESDPMIRRFVALFDR